MSLYKKIILLIFILAVPVGVALFLDLFGENAYTLPVYFAHDSVRITGNKYKITAAETIPAFKFIDQDSNQLSSEQYKGRIFVADFFFTRCPDICPKMTTQLTRVQEAFANDTTIKIISFTVDPKNDTPDVLKKYATLYKANPVVWRFATGNKDSLYALALKGFKISALEDTTQLPSFVHSEKLVLVDKQGWIRGYYNGTKREDVDKLILEINVLKKIYDNENQ
ncbi:MAG: SCO family protein [Cytophagaceae bacterium]|nr:SCO family protein [Cytophagaceae bacterium]MDW8455661.1 SCO family protein [Cytophagaceae bacterium]